MDHTSREHDQLVEKLRVLEDAYNNDAPLVSDVEYDKMKNELLRIEAEHPEWTRLDHTTQKPLFDGWDNTILIEPTQVKNRLNAEKLKAKDVKIDRPSLRAEIQGSASVPYQTDLSGCTCPDFRNRKMPCKHMYRLALELGLIEKFPEVDSTIERAVVQSAAQKWKDEFTQGRISAQLYARVAEALQK